MLERCAHIFCTLTLLIGAPVLARAQSAEGPDFWAVTGVRLFAGYGFTQMTPKMTCLTFPISDPFL